MDTTGKMAAGKEFLGVRQIIKLNTMLAPHALNQLFLRFSRKSVTDEEKQD